jgi:hypothetical protein
MSKAKFEAAKELIQSKHYVEARSILKTIDHPQAAEWLAKLDKIDPFNAAPASPPARRSASRLPLVVVVVIVIGIAAAGGAMAIIQRSNTAASLPTQLNIILSESPSPSANPSSFGTPTVSSWGMWTKDESASAIDDTRTVVISLDAGNKVSGRVLTERPSLLIRCKESALSVYMIARMNVEELNDNSRVRVRLDKTDAEPLNLNISTSGEALFFPDPNDWLSRLIHHDTLAIEFTPLNSSAVVATFDLQGLSSAIAALPPTCVTQSSALALSFTPAPTSSEPIPAKISQDQSYKLTSKCLDYVYSNSVILPDYTRIKKDYSDKGDFRGIGSTDEIFGKDNCSVSEAFQMEWFEYTYFNDLLSKQNMDKGIAWTMFQLGWSQAIANNEHATLTKAAYYTAQPTEITSTP